MIIQTKIGEVLNFDGTVFNPLDPSTAEISLAEIAHGLSMECRWSGKISRFYSVAEHSMMVANIAMSLTGTSGTNFLKVGLAGLLHDATEAYLRDLPTPLKNDPRMDFYREAERGLHERIFAFFDLPPELPDAVIEADRIALAVEQRDLRPFQAMHIPPPEQDFGCNLHRRAPVLPAEAERAFLGAVLSVRHGIALSCEILAATGIRSSE